MNPLVSILIPCYRQGHYLPAAVESALGQSYGDVEVVVVNDGSDDDTEAVARRYGGRIVYHWQPNRGLAAARNAAIARASGKYIHCLDADDRLHPEAIGWLVEAARCRDDVLCVMGARTFDSDEQLEGNEEITLPRVPSLDAQLLMRCFGPPVMYLSPRAMVEDVGGFDRNLRSCEDWELWIRLLFAGAEVVPVNRVGAYYRRHPDSMSRNLLRMAQCHTEVLRRTLRRIDADPQRVVRMGGNPQTIANTIRRRLAKEFFDAGYLLREEGQYLAAFRHYWASLAGGQLNLPALSGMLKLLPHRVSQGSRGGV
jgi:glycosyltransferase involved in cell wall biosynthesis